MMSTTHRLLFLVLTAIALLCGCARQETPLTLPKTELPSPRQQLLRQFELPRGMLRWTLEFNGCLDVVDEGKRSGNAAILILRFFDDQGKNCDFSGLPPTKIFKEPAGFRYLPAGGGPKRFSFSVPVPDRAVRAEVGLSLFNNDWHIELRDFQCTLSSSVFRSLVNWSMAWCIRNVRWGVPLLAVVLGLMAVLMWRKIVPVRPCLRWASVVVLLLMAAVAFAKSDNRVLQILILLALAYASGIWRVWSRLPAAGRLEAWFAEPLPEHPFDVVATNVCKGVAICLMLFHHCFMYYRGGLDAVGVSLQGGGKICVAIFCLLSGFGLMRVKLRGAGIKTDVFHLVKLWVNFWFLAAIWIAFSCLLEGHGFAKVYPDGWFPRFFFDISGLGVPGRCFCPTWWFMGVIVPLYLAFPFLGWLCRKSWPWLLGAAMGMMLVNDFPRNLGVWMWAFVLGMVLAKEGFLEQVQMKLNRLSALGLLAVAVLGFYFRSTSSFVPVGEGFFALIIVFGVYVSDCAFLSKAKWLEGTLVFLGKHSMNIFLIHTYFHLYYLDHLVKLPHYVEFVVILAASLACSVVVEWLKKILGINRAMGKFKKFMA